MINRLKTKYTNIYTSLQKAMRSHRRRYLAFTLAETLIALVTIGVVAALTIPSFMNQINDYTLSKQRSVFEKKFEEGLHQMRVDGKLEQTYLSTEAFVDEMGNYFKIVQVCNYNNLTDCFDPKISTGGYTISYTSNNQTSKTSSNNKESIIISDAMTTKSLIPQASYDSNIVGVKLADGINLLITYNPNCIGAEEGDTGEDVTKCFGYVADVNSKKSPNTIGKDIVSNMNLNGDFQILSKSYASPLNKSQCEELKKTHSEITGCTTDTDYWAGAIFKCDNEGGKLPNEADIKHLFEEMFDSKRDIKNQALWQYVNRNDDGNIDAWLDVDTSNETARWFTIARLNGGKNYSIPTNSARKSTNYYVTYCIK